MIYSAQRADQPKNSINARTASPDDTSLGCSPRSRRQSKQASQDALGTDEADDPEVGPSDASTTSTDTFFPNSIGMSFLVDRDAKAILVKTEWGRYRREKSTTQINKKTGAEAMVWKREPLTGDPLTVSLKNGAFGPLMPRPDTDSAVVVQGKIRQTPRGWVVTIFFVNTRPEQERRQDEAWVFQPKVWVLDAAVSPQPIFLQHRDWKRDLNKMDPDFARGDRDARDAVPTPAGVRSRARSVRSCHAPGAWRHSGADARNAVRPAGGGRAADATDVP